MRGTALNAQKSCFVGQMRVLLFTALPAGAEADDLIAAVARPTPVSAFDGRIVWSDYDPLSQRYFLTQRVDGVTSRLPLEPRSVPFDVDLGPDADGKAVAAYSRCRRDPPVRDPRLANALAQLPDWSRGRRCDVYMYSFDQAREVRVRFTSTQGASEYLPTVWTDRIAFARVYERRRGLGGRRAYLYVRPNALLAKQGPRGRSQRIPAGWRTRDRFCRPTRPRRCDIRLVEPGPTSLDIATRRIAFGWDSTQHGEPTSAVYLDVLRRGRPTAQRRIDRVASGEIQARELIAPRFDEQVRVNWLASFFGDDTTTHARRWSFMEERTEEVELPPLPTDPVRRPVIAGAVDGSGYIYLASGLVRPDGPCATPASCVADPGCSELQPCELRRAVAPVFRRTGP